MHAKFCLVSERALSRSKDSENRPHNENGPSVAWRCGNRAWHIHGVAVDEQIVINPETQTIQQILSEQNEEVRRIRIERFGWERFLRESGSEIRHKRYNERDGQWETLYRLKDGTQQFVCVDPSTGRRYALGCPEECETTEQVQMWMSSGLDAFAIHRS